MAKSRLGTFVKWVLALFVLLVIALIVGYNLLGGAVRKAVETVGPEATGAPVTLQKVDLSLLSGRLGLDGLALGNPPGFSSPSAFKLDRFRVGIGVTSLFGDPLVIKNILVRGAEVTWDGYGGDNHRKILQNVQGFASRFSKRGTSAPKELKTTTGSTRKVIIDEFTLADTTIVVWNGGREIGRVSVPELRLTGIGRQQGGVTWAEAVKEIYSPLVSEAMRAVSMDVEALKRKARELGEGKVEEKAKELSDRLKGLLK